MKSKNKPNPTPSASLRTLAVVVIFAIIIWWFAQQVVSQSKAESYFFMCFDKQEQNIYNSTVGNYSQTLWASGLSLNNRSCDAVSFPLKTG